MPDFHAFAVAVPQPGGVRAEATRVLGSMLRDVMKLSLANGNFRRFGPDETASNRLDEVYSVSGKAWMAEVEAVDTDLSADGRVMEVLSEHLCEGWLEGCLLTGRHGLFSCYEAFRGRCRPTASSATASTACRANRSCGSSRTIHPGA